MAGGKSMNDIWITKWVDYSSKYGLGYLLMNGATGVYFNDSTKICEWAATMAHESIGHSLGNYGHQYKWSVTREYTVPYKIGGAAKRYGGNAFDECCL